MNKTVLVMMTGILMATGCGPVEPGGVEEGAEGETAQVESPLVNEGWNYVRWSSAGLRRYNASTCGGTVHCTLYAGQWVYAGGSYLTCGGPLDVYVHHTPCGFSGWVRADALSTYR